MRIDQWWWWEEGVEWRGVEQTLIAVRRTLDSEAVWQFISVLLHYFFSSEVKQVFNRHCTTELKQGRVSQSNLISVLFFLLISLSFGSHHHHIHIGQV